MAMASSASSSAAAAVAASSGGDAKSAAAGVSSGGGAAEEKKAPALSLPVIRKLDEAVINRIAAGEVIHRPSSALKELIENCLDAKSTKIQVVLKDGGLKLLQVQDNGHGIRVADFPILCERFTTSKLKSYDDLSRIDTFGFRGEALASITHVAHVTITSMTDAQTCAYKAMFGDGKLVAAKPNESAEPKACAGVRGTIIAAEDLFFNVPVRRQALKSASEEYSRCLEVVSKYAVHYCAVSFTCKKFGAPKTDVHTAAAAGAATQRTDTIRTIYGNQIARELLPFKQQNAEYEFTVEGLTTNANFNVKKLTLILFINNRLVESSAIRRTVETVYGTYLPKHTHPWVYLSLHLAARNLDVNVHPTKKEVHFLHEEKIVEAIEQALERTLAGANSSRTFYTQAVLPGVGTATGAAAMAGVTDSASAPPPPPPVGAAKSSPAAATATGTAAPANKNKRKTSETVDMTETTATGANTTPRKATSGGAASTPEYKLVRTDNKSRTIDSYLTANSNASPTAPASGAAAAAGAGGVADEKMESPIPTAPAGVVRRPRPPRGPQLTSIANLLTAVEVATHDGLADIFRSHTFVGCVDETFALIQHKTKLLIVNVATVSKAFFYESVLRQFSDLPRIRLSAPAPIRELVLMGLNSPDGGWVESDGPKDAIATYITDLLVKKGAMLTEYFGIEIDTVASGGDATPVPCILTLPNLLDRYVPPLAYLPLFLLRMGIDVDWQSESGCFHTISDELASFYMIQPDLYLPPAPTSSATASTPSAASSSAAAATATASATAAATASTEPSLRWIIQHVLFPALKSGSAFHPPKRLATDSPPTVTQVAALEQLYKIFERC